MIAPDLKLEGTPSVGGFKVGGIVTTIFRFKIIRLTINGKSTHPVSSLKTKVKSQRFCEIFRTSSRGECKDVSLSTDRGN
jgi:hypothetical protein